MPIARQIPILSLSKSRAKMAAKMGMVATRRETLVADESFSPYVSARKYKPGTIREVRIIRHRSPRSTFLGRFLMQRIARKREAMQKRKKISVKGGMDLRAYLVTTKESPKSRAMNVKAKTGRMPASRNAIPAGPPRTGGDEQAAEKVIFAFRKSFLRKQSRLQRL
jgi:hypothetical protein